MANPELRAHLRIRSEGFAIVTFPDGSKMELRVRDISLGGAYLVRMSGQEGPPPEIGLEVQAYLFHQGHAAAAVTVEATILRAEASGDGFVIRFAVTASPKTSPELLAQIEREAKKQGVAPAMLHLGPSALLSIGGVLGRLSVLAGVGMVVAGVQILFEWLDVVL
jgi:hypothetical protein